MDWKLKESCCALQKLAPYRREAEEDASLIELARSGKLNPRTAAQALRRVDLKKAGLIAGGALAVLAAAGAVSQYRFYQHAVAREMKRQLAPLDRKLDALQAENDALRAEIAQLRQPEASETAEPEA